MSALDELINIFETKKDVLDSFVQEFIQKEEAKKKLRAEVKESIYIQLNNLLDYLKINRHVSDDDIAYDDEGQIPENIKRYFNAVFDELSDYAKENYLDLQEPGDFEYSNFIIKHENAFIQFRLLMGQGSYVDACLIDKVGKIQYFTTEQYANGYKFDTLLKRKIIAKNRFYEFLREIKPLKLNKADLMDVILYVLKGKKKRGIDDKYKNQKN